MTADSTGMREPAHRAAAERVVIALMEAFDAAHLDHVAARYQGELR